MSKVLDWTFRLLDKMSGPAAKIATKLEGVNKEIRATSKVSGSMADQQKHAAFRWNKGVDEMTAKQKEWNKATKANTGTFGDLAESMGGVEAVAGGAILAAYAVAAAMAVKGSRMAIDAAGFRENTVIALKALLGGQEAAEATYEKILDVADRVGLEKADAVASLKKLLSAGFDEAGALSIIEAVANTSAVLGSEAAGRLENFFTVMKSTGKFDLESLKKTGINVESIYGRLAKTMGKTVAEVKALEKAGKLSAEAVTKAVTDEVNKGNIGEALGNTLDRLFGDVVGKVNRLFDKVDLSPLKEAAKAALAAMDGPAGARAREGINKIFGGLFDALFGALDEGRVTGIFDMIADALNIVGDVIKSAAPAVKEFIGGFIDGLVLAWPMLRGTFGAIVAALEPIGGMTGAFAILGKVLGVVAIVAGTLLAVLGAIVSALGYVGAMLIIWAAEGIATVMGFASAMWEAGAAIVSGLVDGILSGASAVIDAIVGVATSAIDAAESALGIASPSKVFAGLGAFTSQGFAEGAANDNSAQDAADSMVEPPTETGARAGARAAAARAGAGAGGGGGGTVINFHIEHVDARGASPEDIEEGFAGVIEQVKLAVNG